MPDKSMCYTIDCENRKNCYLYTAQAKELGQTYRNYFEDGPPCPHYMPTAYPITHEQDAVIKEHNERVFHREPDDDEEDELAALNPYNI